MRLRVTLVGQVARPTLKSDAEKTVKQIEGVERVDNQIQVLPFSPMDPDLAAHVQKLAPLPVRRDER